jgi:lon-related putative ATP-dependent protease
MNIEQGFNQLMIFFEEKRKNEQQKVLEDVIKPLSRISYKEQHKKEKELQLKFTLTAVEPLISKLKNKYSNYPEIIKYLIAAEDDMVVHVNDFIKQDERTNALYFLAESSILINYQVNLLVDNKDKNSAPVVFEDNPTYANLISRVEHVTHFGSLETNFTLIRAGSLHKANGGYLMIDARKIEKDKQAWESLKRALYAKKIIIEPVEPSSDAVRPISLEPMPIPLNVKVILLGNRKTFYSLCNDDSEFSELFKVAVDFDEQIPRNEENIDLYARLIGTYIKKQNLLPFHSSAVARIIDYSTRLTQDIEKLSTSMSNINNLIVESNYWGSLEGKKIINAEDVKNAIRAQIHRIDRARELYYEDITRNYVVIHTQGKTIGQVNCLSVVKTGNFIYGHPTRVSAKVRMGKAKIIDIQEKIDLAGPIHSKGSLILYHFLGGRYNIDHPFLLSASISFEQIYDCTDGDSASVGILCALLSALSDIPVTQTFAVTGAIDQYGMVQAVGRINEKIEGFYDICYARGLTGEQGVLLPVANLKNLMLREDIVEAAKSHKFFIYPIETIDQAISLLTGVSAGKRGKKGKFTKDSINYKVEKRLRKFSKIFDK